jgi:hypothetical protein
MILYSITPCECVNDSLKGSASLSVCVCIIITWDPTIINKGRTREFTTKIIAVEKQPICRMKNDKQAWEYNVKHDNNDYNKKPNNNQLT